MNSPILQIKPSHRPLKSPISDLWIAQVARILMWVLFSGLIGMIFTGLPPAVVEFFQKPLGMFLLITGIVLAGVNFQFSSQSLLVIIILSLLFTLVVQGLMRIINMTWPTKYEVLQQNIQKVLKNNQLI